MIKHTCMYSIVCDICRKRLESKDGVYATEDRDIIVEYALESNWITIGSKHYCPDCYVYDENTDNNIPKTHESSNQ